VCGGECVGVGVVCGMSGGVSVCMCVYVCVWGLCVCGVWYVCVFMWACVWVWCVVCV